jgi:NAD(P)-dependent dehydrogenase (short-subunit alcohol dehydrogenase family)
MLLNEQRTIITGGGRGIGRAIAMKFAAEGAKVVLAARTPAEVQAVAEEIRAAGGHGEGIAADLSTVAGCEKVFRVAADGYGGVDILVNNAGVLGPVAPVVEITPEEWDAVMAANLKSAFLLSRLALPGMVERGSGTILNVSSVAAKMAFGLNAAYAASKAGLIALTRTLAAEASGRGVRVNAICPGPVPATHLSKELGAGLAKRFGGTPEEILQGALKGILQGRPQTIEEIATVALFLCSEQASAITGQALNIDGGMAFF